MDLMTKQKPIGRTVEERRRCSHQSVPGYCQDCGSKVFTAGDELFYEKFKDIFNMGLLKAMQQIDSIKSMEELIEMKEKMYPVMRQLVEGYNCADIDVMIERLRTGQR